LGVVEKDSFFGELSFFTNQPRENSARTLTFCSIFRLTFEKFYEALERFPSDKEMYHVLKDQTNLLQDYACVGTQCWLCGDSHHIAGYCPKAHLCLDKQEVIQQHLEKTQEFYKNFKRNNRPKYHALTKLNETRKASGKIHSLRNQMTTSMTEVDSTLHDLRKSRKQISGPADDYLEGASEDSQNIEGFYPTLVHANEEDAGFIRFKREKKFGSNNKEVFNKSYTMKHQGEAAFSPLKVKLHEPKRYKIEEVVIDQVKNYEIYFPHNNITKVIEQIEYSRSRKKYFKTKLMTEQDITQFKAKLGKLFDKTKRMGSVEILKSPINRPSSRSPYVRQRSKSVKDVNAELSYTRKRSGSVKPNII